MDRKKCLMDCTRSFTEVGKNRTAKAEERQSKEQNRVRSRVHARERERERKAIIKFPAPE